MNPEFFIYLLFGHIVGDYWLQPRWMALNKGNDSSVCFQHCCIYATAVTCWTWWFLPDTTGAAIIWLLFLGVTHFPIDRWSLASLWTRKLLGGADLGDFVKRTPWAGTSDSDKNMNILDGAFRAFCYVVIDNSAHLMIAWFGMKLMHAIA